MSIFSGRQSQEPKRGRPNKGIMKIHREILHEEAEARNSNTPLERTRSYRLSKEKEAS